MRAISRGATLHSKNNYGVRLTSYYMYQYPVSLCNYVTYYLLAVQ